MEVLPKEFTAKAAGESYFTLIIKNTEHEPKTIKIINPGETIVTCEGGFASAKIELERSELIAKHEEISSVRVKVTISKATPLSNISMANSLRLEIQDERGVMKPVNIKVGELRVQRRIYENEDEMLEGKSSMDFERESDEEQIRNIEAFLSQKNASSKNTEKQTNQKIFNQILKDRIKETESNFEESGSESSFLEFKRKLETGKLENLKMVSSFEPKTKEWSERPEQPEHPDILECYENLITGNQVLEQKLKTVAKGLNKKDAMITNLGGFVVFLESQLDKLKKRNGLLNSVEFLMENENGDISQMRRKYYAEKIEAESALNKAEMNLGEMQREIMRVHEREASDYLQRKEVVTWGKSRCQREMFFMEDFGFFDLLAEEVSGATGEFQMGKTLDTLELKLKKELSQLREELSKHKLRSKKNDKMIKFLNQNNEKLESQLNEAVERELQLTGEMRELALKGDRSNTHSKKLGDFKRENSKLQDELFAKNKEIAQKIRVIGDCEEEVEDLKKELEKVEREKYRIEMEGKDELEELRKLVEQVDLAGHSKEREAEEMRQVKLLEIRERERLVDLREMELSLKETQDPKRSSLKLKHLMGRLEKLLHCDHKRGSMFLSGKKKLDQIERKAELMKDMVKEKMENWDTMRGEYKYQQSLMEQTNAILKRRLVEMEDLLEQKEKGELQKENEIERLRVFIGERKELEREFQKGFKFLEGKLKDKTDWKKECLDEQRKIRYMEEEMRNLVVERNRESRQLNMKQKQGAAKDYEVQKLNQENQKLRRKIEQLREIEIGSNKTKEQIAEEILEMKESILKFREERRRVERAMEGMDKEGKLMVLENDTMEGYVLALIEDKATWKTEKAEMKRKILELNIRIEECGEEISGKDGEIGVLLAVAGEKEKRVQELKDEVRKTKEAVSNMRRELKKLERDNVEQVGTLKGELEELRDQHEYAHERSGKLEKQIIGMEKQEKTRGEIFDRVLEKASLIMSKRLSVLEKTVFMHKVGKKEEWKTRREDSRRMLKEIEMGKFKQVNGVIEYLTSGGGLAGTKGDWMSIIKKDKQEFFQLASKALCASASEAVLKSKLKEAKEQNEELKAKETRGKWLKEKLKTATRHIQDMVERMEQKKLFSKGWKEQMGKILVQLGSIQREVRLWKKTQKEAPGQFDMMNFFRNLAMIKEIRDFGGTEKTNTDPRQICITNLNEEERVGKTVRKLINNTKVIEKDDWMGELREMEMGGITDKNHRFQQVEIRQILLLAEKCNEELIAENRRLKVIDLRSLTPRNS